MKFRVFVFFIFMVLGIGAYAKESAIVSIIPQKTFLDAIVGEHLSSEVMVGKGQSPHTYEPKPSQMSALEGAKVYFSIGVEFEDVWLPKFEAINKNLKIVDSGAGIERIEMAKHEHEEHHDHDSHDEGMADEHKHEGSDPHIWLSPANAKIISKNMLKGVVAIDPKNQESYEANYEKLIQKLDALDEEIKKILSDVPQNSKFIVFHPSFGYFAKEYGLVQVPLEIDGKTPKAKDIAKIIEEVKENSVKVVIAQPEFTEKYANIIAKESGAKVISISPLSPQYFENLIFLAKTISGK